jgi:hypothetical protein
MNDIIASDETATDSGPLSENATVVKYGGTCATAFWLVGNIAVGFTNIPLSTAFVAGNANGWIDGHTPSGMIDQYTLGMFGYAIMLVDAVVNPANRENLVTVIGGALACGQGIAYELKEYRAQKEMAAQLKEEREEKLKANPPSRQQRRLMKYRDNIKKVIGFPGQQLRDMTDSFHDETSPKSRKIVNTIGKGLSFVINAPGQVVSDIVKYTPHLFYKPGLDEAKRFKDNKHDVLSRPLFKPAILGIGCDLAFSHNGLVHNKAAAVTAGILWAVGWGFAGISKSMEGRKHIFQQWRDMIRDIRGGKKPDAIVQGAPSPQQN